MLPSTTLTYEQALAGATNPANWSAITTTTTTVSGGLTATQIVATATGAGTYPAGTVRYGYLVDWAGQGIVAIFTSGADGQSQPGDEPGGRRPRWRRRSSSAAEPVKPQRNARRGSAIAGPLPHCSGRKAPATSARP